MAIESTTRTTYTAKAPGGYEPFLTLEDLEELITATQHLPRDTTIHLAPSTSMDRIDVYAPKEDA